MSRIGPIAKILGLCTFVCLFAAMLMALIPELWFRSQAISYLAPRIAARLGYSFQVENLDCWIRRPDWKTVQFNLSWTSARISTLDKNAPLSISTKVEKLATQASFSWFHFPPKLGIIDQLIAQISDLELRSTAGNHDLSARVIDLKQINSILNLINHLEKGKDEVAVNVLHAAYREGNESPIEFSLDVHKAEDKISLNTPLSLPLTLKVQADLPGIAGITGKGKLSIIVQPGAGCKQLSTPKNAECLAGQIQWKPQLAKQGPASLDWVAHSNSKDLKITIQSNWSKPHHFLPLLGSKSPCLLHLWDGSGPALNTAIQCEVEATLNLPPFKAVPTFKLPTQTAFTIDLFTQLKNSGKDLDYQGKLKLEAHPILEPLLIASFVLESDFKGLGSKLTQTASLDLKTKIPEMKKVIGLLNKTPWAIPAPLNNLSGSIQLGLTSHWKDWETTAPFELSTDLQSPEQALKTTTTGTVTLNGNILKSEQVQIGIDADCTLKNVRLAAPKFDLRSIPRFYPAKEIQKTKRRPTEPTVVTHYLVRVKTARFHPIQIDSNLLQAPANLVLDAVFDDRKGVSVGLDVLPMKFEMFRKKARLESFQFVTAQNTSAANIEGIILTHSGDYEVKVRFFGKPEAIKVQLSSVPYAPEADLWSILLFGEPLQHLDPDRQTTAQSTSQALSEGALGIVSFFLFASTPIQRVNYDPTTQFVSVYFKVAEGTTLEVGSSGSANAEIGLRKRLGKGWTLNTRVGGSEASDKKTQIGAGLEWSSRY